MTIVILFGASGDICRKKVYPALYNIYSKNNNYFNKIIGYGRSELKLSQLYDKINIKDNRFLNLFDYQQGQYNSFDDFKKLKNLIDNNINNNEQIIIYFGVPSIVFCDIIKNIYLAQIENEYSCKYLFEKPIGYDFNSCKIILNLLSSFIEEKNINIIDNYLGKNKLIQLSETRKKNLKSIKIILNEKEDVNHRIQYFDDVGLFKDMIQSHVMSILFYCFSDNFKIDDQNYPKIINCNKGQYNGYNGSNNVETFIKLELRWNEINISIIAGKGMNEDIKEVSYADDLGIFNYKINSKESEYINLFDDICKKNINNKFLSKKKVLYFWKISENILDNISNIEINKYDIPKNDY